MTIAWKINVFPETCRKTKDLDFDAHEKPTKLGFEQSAIVLGEGWRVRPLDHLQWVLERRVRGSKRVRERWVPWAYCRTRAGLETALSRLKAEGVAVDPEPLTTLPERFESRCE